MPVTVLEVGVGNIVIPILEMKLSRLRQAQSLPYHATGRRWQC